MHRTADIGARQPQQYRFHQDHCAVWQSAFWLVGPRDGDLEYVQVGGVDWGARQMPGQAVHRWSIVQLGTPRFSLWRSTVVFPERLNANVIGAKGVLHRARQARDLEGAAGSVSEMGDGDEALKNKTRKLGLGLLLVAFPLVGLSYGYSQAATALSPTAQAIRQYAANLSAIDGNSHGAGTVKWVSTTDGQAVNFFNDQPIGAASGRSVYAVVITGGTFKMRQAIVMSGAGAPSGTSRYVILAQGSFQPFGGGVSSSRFDLATLGQPVESASIANMPAISWQQFQTHFLPK